MIPVMMAMVEYQVMTPLLMTVRMVAALSSPHQVSSGCTLVLGGIPVGLLKLHPDINLPCMRCPVPTSHNTYLSEGHL